MTIEATYPESGAEEDLIADLNEYGSELQSAVGSVSTSTLDGSGEGGEASANVAANSNARSADAEGLVLLEQFVNFMTGGNARLTEIVDATVAGEFTTTYTESVKDTGLVKMDGANANDGLAINLERDEGAAFTTLRAGSGDDTVLGSEKKDDINGMKGDDLLFTRGGDDRVRLNEGTDVAAAGTGNDKIFVGKGEHFVDGGEGEDELVLGGGVEDYDIDLFRWDHDNDENTADLEVMHIVGAGVDVFAINVEEITFEGKSRIGDTITNRADVTTSFDDLFEASSDNQEVEADFSTDILDAYGVDVSSAEV